MVNVLHIDYLAVGLQQHCKGNQNYPLILQMGEARRFEADSLAYLRPP